MSTRIAFLGDRNVGKTSMASRMLQLDYLSIDSQDLYASTREISTIVQLDELLEKSPDWAECLVMVYNIGSLKTFDVGTKLFTHALGYRNPRVAIMVAIVDGANERIVNQNDVEQFMEDYKGFDWHFLETSIRDFQYLSQPPIQSSFFLDHYCSFTRRDLKDGNVVDSEVTVEDSLYWSSLPMPKIPFGVQSGHSLDISSNEESTTKSSKKSMVNAMGPFATQGQLWVLLDAFIKEAVDASWYNVVDDFIVEEDAQEWTVDKGVNGDHLEKAFRPPHVFQFQSNGVIQTPPEQEAPQLKSKSYLESTLGFTGKIKELKSWSLGNANLDSTHSFESFFLEENTLDNIGGRLRVKLRGLRDLLCCL
ncbi:uncharacterized protein EAF02_007308 [Botrytis sinoallii]|uniref:uncharacterized protein n=1 Tax=Botrytis sinoallii TaxID=1463999 RepID=UPI00190004AE|nr:uncharacterized protein EAF02_007308 [Botrytis sinoallii]KAF7880462.1 hypothetical protein EAF02_007308 [Botrytis sinoallii]